MVSPIPPEEIIITFEQATVRFGFFGETRECSFRLIFNLLTAEEWEICFHSKSLKILIQLLKGTYGEEIQEKFPRPPTLALRITGKTF